MALKVIGKDILTVESGVICHQVNCQGKMGAGIAAQIRKKWPQVFKLYQDYCLEAKQIRASGIELLGQCQIIPITNDLSIANVFGQLGYGPPTNGVYTEYDAVDMAFAELAKYTGSQIYIPYKMGCGLAGGNWDKYSAIIEKWIPGAIVCQIPVPV